MDFKRITDPETKIIAGLAESLRADYETDAADPWAESPFRWIKKRPSRQVGAIGEKLVAGCHVHIHKAGIWVATCQCGWGSAGSRWHDAKWLADDHLTPEAMEETP